MTILIVGGTGRLGRILVQSLIDESANVRILTRNAVTAAEMREQGVEAVVGDLRDDGAVRRAVDGCAAVVAAASGFGPMGSATPTSVDRDGNLTLIDEAVKARVDRFIFVSAWGVAPDAQLELRRMKYAAEQALTSSGMRWTIIRPAAFLETYIEIVGQPMERRNATLVFGSGEVAINFVSVRDVAALVRKALRDDSLAGRVIDWGGVDLTLGEVSDAIHVAAGQPGRTRHVPLAALRVASVMARPFSPFAARAAAAAVDMISRPTPFDSAPERSRHPELPGTTLEDAMAEWSAKIRPAMTTGRPRSPSTEPAHRPNRRPRRLGG